MEAWTTPLPRMKLGAANCYTRLFIRFLFSRNSGKHFFFFSLEAIDPGTYYLTSALGWPLFPQREHAFYKKDLNCPNIQSTRTRFSTWPWRKSYFAPLSTTHSYCWTHQFVRPFPLDVQYSPPPGIVAPPPLFVVKLVHGLIVAPCVSRSPSLISFVILILKLIL